MPETAKKKPRKPAKKKARGKGGRPSYEPTKVHRAMVKEMAGYGIKRTDISRVLDITENTLRKHFRDELDTGSTIANGKVAKSLYNNAVKHNNVSAQIFWMKARAGWKETSKYEHGGPDGQPLPASPVDEIMRRIDGIASRATEAAASKTTH